VSNPGKIFLFYRTSSGPPSFLLNGYLVAFQGLKRWRREVSHSSTFIAEV
jgi:hypothetical protein